MEHLQTSPNLTEVYDRLLKLEPKPVDNSVPIDSAEQRAAFLSREQHSPNHTYAKLNSIDFASKDKEIRGDDLMFTFVLLGKADPTNPTHLRSMRETVSV